MPFFSELDDKLLKFIGEQKLFFTATAPREGRINLSPKGMDTFRCIDRRHVAYLDLTGSGNETAAHIFENGRLTVMMCSFNEQPLILRLYGRGRIVLPRHGDWATLFAHFQEIPGMRQIVLLSIDSIQTSCGFGVPLYEYAGERETLRRWGEKKGDDGVRAYWESSNQESIDGLPTHLLVD